MCSWQRGSDTQVVCGPFQTFVPCCIHFPSSTSWPQQATVRKQRLSNTFWKFSRQCLSDHPESPKVRMVKIFLRERSPVFSSRQCRSIKFPKVVIHLLFCIHFVSTWTIFANTISCMLSCPLWQGRNKQKNCCRNSSQNNLLWIILTNLFQLSISMICCRSACIFLRNFVTSLWLFVWWVHNKVFLISECDPWRLGNETKMPSDFEQWKRHKRLNGQNSHSIQDYTDGNTAQVHFRFVFETHSTC